jgi:beta-xylosidase
MKYNLSYLFILAVFGLMSCKNANYQLDAPKGNVSEVWCPDNGDGTYKNPIIHADYSDPDAIRVGEDFFMVSSSFNCAPGLPILHSKDLVNWTILCNALPVQKPVDFFSRPQHGKGVWAPAIRFHNDEFYIYYPDPDFGIYLIKAKNPAGPWSSPILVKEAKGWIDPCPLWDEDGRVWMIHAFAGSRAGHKSTLAICPLSADGTKVIGDDVMVFDGHLTQPTLEGPKLYKRNGYYYIFAPAGGVTLGWQLVMRSKNLFGPYEVKKVMDQGKSPINGPHQGAWVELENGESWFLHFQDKDAFGRVVLLEPMFWLNDWPIIGLDPDGDGIGQPVLNYNKPKVGGTFPMATPQSSDEFNSPAFGIQWQWHAIPRSGWAFPTNQGFLRMNCIQSDAKSLYQVPNLFMQKFIAQDFAAVTKISFYPHFDNEKIGLLVMGNDYAYISAEKADKRLKITHNICLNANKDSLETISDSAFIDKNVFYLKAKVEANSSCSFYYSTDSLNFKPLGKPFKAKQGGWIGAKIGLFATRKGFINDAGYADIDWFRIVKP